MNLRYYADIENINRDEIRLEIYVNEYSGTPEELILDSSAISIEYSAESLFDALKPSLAHINMYTTDIKMDLFSTNYNDVVVIVYKNSDLFWVGYVTPNVYNQPYVYNYDPITLECVDIISNLGNMQYKSNNGITTLLNVISKCLDMADSNHYIQTIYVDKNISLSGNDRILENIFIEERNFFDEKMEAANCDEVVGSILKTLGLTMVQYKDAFYIIEQGDNLFSGTYTLNEYNLSNGQWSYNSTSTITLPVNNTYTIGAGGINGQISLDNVYNKITIVANNNPLDSMLPDFGDKGDLVNQDIDDQHYEDINYTIDNTTYKLLGAYFTSDNDWTNYPMYCLAESTGTAYGVNEMHMSLLRDSYGICGMIWNRATQYNVADGEPSSISWKNYLSIMNWQLSGYAPYISLRKRPTMIFDGGYLIVNMTYKLSTSRFPHDAVRSQYDSFEAQGYYDKVWSDNPDYIGNGLWPNYTMFPCLLKIGDYFYNGETWILQSDYNDKVAWWNTIYVNYFGLNLAGNYNWYRIWNTTHDDWEYVTETQYNNFSGTKETGACPTNHARYILRYDAGETYVYIPDEFYYEKEWGNYCFLIRKNVAGENIMDTNYQLTNTVSYKMKIINASDGMAIKIDRPLYGEVQFEIYEPIDNIYGSLLGLDPQYQSNKPNGTCRAVHISNLSLRYQKTSAYQDIFNNEDVNPDTIYSNVVNSDYCKELEDIILTVNTANDWANSYSYLIKQNGNSYDYVKNLGFSSTSKRPEERLVEKYVNYYSEPKIKYGATILNNMEIYPFQPIYEIMNNTRKNFVTCNLTYNLSSNTIDINTCQI